MLWNLCHDFNFILRTIRPNLLLQKLILLQNRTLLNTNLNQHGEYQSTTRRLSIARPIPLQDQECIAQALRGQDKSKALPRGSTQPGGRQHPDQLHKHQS